MDNNDIREQMALERRITALTGIRREYASDVRDAMELLREMEGILLFDGDAWRCSVSRADDPEYRSLVASHETNPARCIAAVYVLWKEAQLT